MRQWRAEVQQNIHEIALRFETWDVREGTRPLLESNNENVSYARTEQERQETGRRTNPGHQQGHRKLLEMVCQKQKEHKKWESSKKIKSLEKKRLCFHGVSSTRWGLCVMGQKKCGMSSSFWSGSKPLILDRVGFVRAVTGLEYGPWTTLRHAQSSAKCEKLTYLYSSPKKNCCVTTLQEFRPNWVGKSKSIFKIVFHFQSITLYSRNTGTSHFYIFTRNLLAPDYNKAFSFCLKAGLIKKPTKQKPSENWIAPKLWYREGFLSF